MEFSVSHFVRTPDMPFVVLWSVLLLAGLLVFQDFGISWDEPLLYQYGDAVRYAYSPREWFSGSFNLERAYGPSAEDHKIYGAAYWLVARPAVQATTALTGSSDPDAWHLVNFLTFMGGLLPFYSLSKRCDEPSGGRFRHSAPGDAAGRLGPRFHQSQGHALHGSCSSLHAGVQASAWSIG